MSEMILQCKTATHTFAIPAFFNFILSNSGYTKLLVILGINIGMQTNTTSFLTTSVLPFCVMQENPQTAMALLGLYTNLMKETQGFYYPDGQWVRAHRAKRRLERGSQSTKAYTVTKHPRKLSQSKYVALVKKAVLAKEDLALIWQQPNPIDFGLAISYQQATGFHHLIHPSQFFCQRPMSRQSKDVVGHYHKTGNSTFKNFKIMAIGENHDLPDERMKIIAQFAKEGDIVLLEGYPVGYTFPCSDAYPKAIENQVIDYCLPKGVTCMGWDDGEGEAALVKSSQELVAHKNRLEPRAIKLEQEIKALQARLKETTASDKRFDLMQAIKSRQASSQEIMQEWQAIKNDHLKKSIARRNRFLMQTIKTAERLYPDKRIFVSAGLHHFSHEYATELNNFLAARQYILYAFDEKQALTATVPKP